MKRMEDVKMKNKIFPISIGILWAITFSNATHSWILGIMMGLCMAMVFGLYDKEEEKGDLKNEKHDE